MAKGQFCLRNHHQPWTDSVYSSRPVFPKNRWEFHGVLDDLWRSCYLQVFVMRTCALNVWVKLLRPGQQDTWVPGQHGVCLRWGLMIFPGVLSKSKNHIYAWVCWFKVLVFCLSWFFLEFSHHLGIIFTRSGVFSSWSTNLMNCFLSLGAIKNKLNVIHPKSWDDFLRSINRCNCRPQIEQVHPNPKTRPPRGLIEALC